ncbi:hypothetical protein PMZ80_008262 [Knufia obscura]|uniref:Aromatic-L-amino-acid decarboxylase n=2 Tax=Knufia TaxID=430999 RepID=A0AAN8ERI7_9EURO|nr:hypothetical protein PMZ80_008262 [Knufia obscura]KAK5957012.1 hypothetical protein OHC33_001381 [Knufia fluminis]
MNADQFRTAAHAAIEEIIQYNTSVATGTLPVLPAIKPGYLRPQLPSHAPNNPEPWSSIQPDIAKSIIPGLTHWQSPNFMAFFPACTTYPSILGEMYSSAFTAPAFNWLCSPACTELETIVLDWLADALHLPGGFRSDSPNGGGGVIQGSASEAIVTVMVAARERYLNRRADARGLANPSPEREKWIAEMRPRLVALSSDQAHSSTAKGAIIAGTYHRMVETTWEEDLAVQPGALERTIKKCIEDGLEPYYITLSYGTTSTCAQDPLHLLAPVLEKYPDIWIHIDAAYAGTALICPEYANVDVDPSTSNNGTNDTIPIPNGMPPNTQPPASDTSLLSQPSLSNPHGALPAGPQTWSAADSFNTNLHKWLLTSFDASLLYIKSRSDLTSALSITPAYLQNKHTDSGLVTDYRDWQIPLGRRFRALKIWFVVRSYGVEGLRGHIRRTVRVGGVFEGLVRDTREGRELFEVVGRPAFGLVCFRVRPGAIPRELVGVGDGSAVEEPEEGVETENGIEGSPFGTVEQQEHGKGNEQSGTKDKKAQSTPAETAEDLANRFSKQVVETINDGCQLFLTSSSTHGKTFIRVVCGNPNSSEEFVAKAFETIVKTTKDVLRQAVEEHQGRS